MKATSPIFLLSSIFVLTACGASSVASSQPSSNSPTTSPSTASPSISKSDNSPVSTPSNSPSSSPSSSPTSGTFKGASFNLNSVPLGVQNFLQFIPQGSNESIAAEIEDYMGLCSWVGSYSYSGTLIASGGPHHGLFLPQV